MRRFGVFSYPLHPPARKAAAAVLTSLGVHAKLIRRKANVGNAFWSSAVTGCSTGARKNKTKTNELKNMKEQPECGRVVYSATTPSLSFFLSYFLPVTASTRVFLWNFILKVVSELCWRHSNVILGRRYFGSSVVTSLCGVC